MPMLGSRASTERGPTPSVSADRGPLLSAQAQVGLEGAALEALLDGRQEARGVGAVDEPVVVRQRQVDHRPRRDQSRRGPGRRRRPARLTTAPVPRIADLRLVDDRRVEQRAAAAGVGQRERAAGQLVRADLVGAGALGEVGDLAWPGRRC